MLNGQTNPAIWVRITIIYHNLYEVDLFLKAKPKVISYNFYKPKVLFHF